uniref:Uncharacterized protein n=1 Tax=Strongyloides venezuelensis TaxID=75913 RepID=A0A0K0FHE8_STRVS
MLPNSVNRVPGGLLFRRPLPARRLKSRGQFNGGGSIRRNLSYKNAIHRGGSGRGSQRGRRNSARRNSKDHLTRL